MLTMPNLKVYFQLDFPMSNDMCFDTITQFVYILLQLAMVYARNSRIKCVNLTWQILSDLTLWGQASWIWMDE